MAYGRRSLWLRANPDMRRRNMIALFCLVFAAGLIARLPLSVAVGIAVPDRLALRFRTAVGTVWDGRLEGVSLAQHFLGDLTIFLRPLPLLSGRLSVDWRIDRPGLQGAGRMIRSLGGDIRLRGIDLDGRVSDLPTLIPLSGQVGLQSAHFHWAADGCQAAGGRIETDALTGGLPQLDWRGPVLTGDLACSGNALQLRMSGAQAGDRLEVLARLHTDSRYELTVTVDTESGRVLSTLSMLGFAATEDGRLRLMQTGSLEREGEL